MATNRIVNLTVRFEDCGIRKCEWCGEEKLKTEYYKVDVGRKSLFPKVCNTCRGIVAKVCNTCGESKLLTEFAFNNKKTGKRAGLCRKCLSKKGKLWRQKNAPERTRRIGEDPEMYAKKGRNRHLKYTYGITLVDYEKILSDQNGVCGICGTDVPGGHGAWHVDHDHETGIVRGLLCVKCNVGIGHFNHDTERLNLAVKYLAKSA